MVCATASGSIRWPAGAIPRTWSSFGDLMPEIETGDMEAIASPIDFLGVNYYNPDYVVDDPGATPLHVRFANRPEMEHTAMGWIVQPSAFAELLVRLHTDYELGPLYITENGAAYNDPLPQDGSVADPRRARYIHDHLEAILEARAAGAPVEGYFAWSLLDNLNGPRATASASAWSMSISLHSGAPSSRAAAGMRG